MMLEALARTFTPTAQKTTLVKALGPRQDRLSLPALSSALQLSCTPFTDNSRQPLSYSNAERHPTLSKCLASIESGHRPQRAMHVCASLSPACTKLHDSQPPPMHLHSNAVSYDTQSILGAKTCA